MIITKEYLEKFRSKSGGWSRKQLTALGVRTLVAGEFKVKKGWKKFVIGKELSPENQNVFEGGRVKKTDAEKAGRVAQLKQEKTDQMMRETRKDHVPKRVNCIRGVYAKKFKV